MIIHSMQIDLPETFCQQMQRELGKEYPAFLASLQRVAPVSIRFNPGKSFPGDYPGIQGEVPWCKDGFYLSERPLFTLDPLFHAGTYYVQEASSMFISHILQKILPATPVRFLDLCAAPGGKTTLIASHLPENSLLIANEYVKSRANILKENVIKWGNDNIVVTSDDPVSFKKFKGAFDLILIDAPCSGEGMFRKDPGAIGEWSVKNREICQLRQQKIIRDVWDALSPDGFLIYSTCTYNRGENEEIIKWIIREYGAESIEIKHPFQGIQHDTEGFHIYRFYPHKLDGEGFFVSVLQKKDGEKYSPPKTKTRPAGKEIKIPEEIKNLITDTEKLTLYYEKEKYGVIPADHEKFVRELESGLNILYKGCELADAEFKKMKLSHALALYKKLNKKALNVYELDRENALRYLRKEDVPVAYGTGDWVLIQYRGVPLGWCKNVGNRLNNYYPKEWRIRMK